jgi:ketosteroid isomerase-like protein
MAGRRDLRRIVLGTSISLGIVLAAALFWWASQGTFQSENSRGLGPAPFVPAAAKQGSPAASGDSRTQEPATGSPAAAAEADKPIQKAPAEKSGNPGPGAAAADATARALAAEKQKARSLMGSGNYEAAAANIKEALRLAPADPEARQLASLLNELPLQKLANEALNLMLESKRRAEQADARRLAAKSFDAAQNEESAARGLLASRRFADAATRFYAANGHYVRSAAEADAEQILRRNREQQQEQETQNEILRGQAESSLNAFDQQQREAAKSEASTRSPLKYQEATRIAAEAQAKWDVADYAAAKKEFDRAAELMRQARDEARTASRGAEPPAGGTQSKPIEAPLPVASPTETDRRAISALMQRYAAVLQSRDMQALKSIWPGLSGQQEQALVEEFRNAREIEVVFSDVEVKISGDSATATALRTYGIQVADGPRLKSESRTTITFRRNAKTWLIDRIRFEPIR